MRIFSTTVTIAAGLLIGSVAAAQDVVWTLEGLEAPESAYFDEARNVLYVSNINGEPLVKDGNGYISRVSPDGEMLEAKWVTGLDAPKGLVSDGVTLYVSDIDRLLAIDIETGEISGTWPAKGAIFLNDTALDAAGSVYVSDMIADKIHVLTDGALSVLSEGEALQHPNGLNMRDGKLLVAPWGLDLQDDLPRKLVGISQLSTPKTAASRLWGPAPPSATLMGWNRTATAIGLYRTGSPERFTASPMTGPKRCFLTSTWAAPTLSSFPISPC